MKKQPLLPLLSLTIGMMILGIPIALYIQYYSYLSLGTIFNATLIAWFFLCLGLIASTRWVGRKAVTSYIILLLIGLPIVAITALSIGMFVLNPPFLCWAFALWSLFAGILIHHAKLMYIALHVANFLIGFGLFLVSILNPDFYNTFPFFLISVAVFFILIGAYQPLTALLTKLPFMQQPESQPATPKSETPSYNAGYRPTASYHEGNHIHTYQPETPEQTQAQYPQQMQ